MLTSSWLLCCGEFHVSQRLSTFSVNEGKARLWSICLAPRYVLLDKESRDAAGKKGPWCQMRACLCSQQLCTAFAKWGDYFVQVVGHNSFIISPGGGSVLPRCQPSVRRLILPSWPMGSRMQIRTRPLGSSALSLNPTLDFADSHCTPPPCTPHTQTACWSLGLLCTVPVIYTCWISEWVFF